ncbi:hypothetical protein [Ureaplasma ceti]|uniref:Protein CR006 P-loop domain-containing protein n=1 Tax=Ureaplasma ceti TaxID=3119530 RepID=A0ABP9U5S8_9BACT
MEKIDISIKNCFGINNLNLTLNFKDFGNIVAIYAKNGVMKTSFSNVFKAIEKNMNNKNNRSIGAYYIKQNIYSQDDSKQIKLRIDDKEINKTDDIKSLKNTIHVIENFIDNNESVYINSLFTDKDIQKDLEQFISNKKQLIEKLCICLTGADFKQYNKLPKNYDIVIYELEEKIKNIFGQNKSENFLSYLDEIKSKLLLWSDSEIIKFEKINYIDLFNDDMKKKLTKDGELIFTVDQIKFFLNDVDKIFQKFKFLSKENSFTLFSLKKIKNSLEDNNFFVNNNFLFLGTHVNAYEENSISETKIQNIEELNKVINEIENSINNINSLKSINELMTFKKHLMKWEICKNFIVNNTNIVDFIFKHGLKELEKLILIKYIKENPEIEELFNRCFDDYKNVFPKLEKINIEDKLFKFNEFTKVFQDRFDLPIKMEITNIKDLIIGNTTYANTKYHFNFDKKNNSYDFGNLIDGDILSKGEVRSLWFFNELFTIEKIKNDIENKDIKDCLLIMDDPVDSFDYKNKHAFLEYILEISEKMKIIILTHNYDFYRLICSRTGIQEENRYIIHKNKDDMFHKLIAYDDCNLNERFNKNKLNNLVLFNNFGENRKKITNNLIQIKDYIKPTLNKNITSDNQITSKTKDNQITSKTKTICEIDKEINDLSNYVINFMDKSFKLIKDSIIDYYQKLIEEIKTIINLKENIDLEIKSINWLIQLIHTIKPFNHVENDEIFIIKKCLKQYWNNTKKIKFIKITDFKTWDFNSVYENKKLINSMLYLKEKIKFYLNKYLHTLEDYELLNKKLSLINKINKIKFIKNKLENIQKNNKIIFSEETKYIYDKCVCNKIVENKIIKNISKITSKNKFYKKIIQFYEDYNFEYLDDYLIKLNNCWKNTLEKEILCFKEIVSKIIDFDFMKTKINTIKNYNFCHFIDLNVKDIKNEIKNLNEQKQLENINIDLKDKIKSISNIISNLWTHLLNINLNEFDVEKQKLNVIEEEVRKCEEDFILKSHNFLREVNSLSKAKKYLYYSEEKLKLFKKIFNISINNKWYTILSNKGNILSKDKAYLKQIPKDTNVNKFNFFSSLNNECDSRCIVSLIPFLRNIIEYKTSNYGNDNNYLSLTKALHYSNNLNQIKLLDLKEIYKKELPNFFKNSSDNHDTNPSKDELDNSLLYIDELELQTKLIVEKYNWDILFNEFNLDNYFLEDLKNKIIVSIWLRIMSEKYIFYKILEQDESFFEKNKIYSDMNQIKDKECALINFLEKESNQFKVLLRLINKIDSNSFKNENTMNEYNLIQTKEKIVKILNSINLVTPEVIHLNSFMYEPIIDLDINRIVRLYEQLKKIIDFK